METAELALIPMPGAGHLAPTVELGKTLTNRDSRISVTIFIMALPFESHVNSSIQTLITNQPPPRMRFVHLTLDEPASKHLRSKFWVTGIVEFNMSRVKDFYSSRRPKAFVLDMYCVPFADVANELGVPSYVFFTSNASFLSFVFHLQSLSDDQNKDIAEFKDTELSIPGFVCPVPAKVIPFPVFHEVDGWSAIFVDVPRMMRKTKGILVNTFAELESYAVKCLSGDNTVPPIYTVGPLLNLKVEKNNGQYDDIMTWLDGQPPASVIFLCFGSLGSFALEQVLEIAHALEQSGHRFLWSLRRYRPMDKLMELSSESENFNDMLPEGFLDRTKGIGKVIGWAPQVAVLSHQACGGFVTHCGWNSIMESLWCGVPMATWPLIADQQLNAFEMVKELGLAAKITFDFHKENPVMLTSEEIKRGIKQLMEGKESEEIKMKVRAKKEESRRVMLEGGSSYAAVGNFIEEVINCPS